MNVSCVSGVFGFASMGNSTLPGNAALSDIVSAVQFIIANAGSFNGDPESVTLGGRFSGAMAISALLTMDSFYRYKYVSHFILLLISEYALKQSISLSGKIISSCLWHSELYFTMEQLHLHTPWNQTHH